MKRKLQKWFLGGVLVEGIGVRVLGRAEPGRVSEIVWVHVVSILV